MPTRSVYIRILAILLVIIPGLVQNRSSLKNIGGNLWESFSTAENDSLPVIHSQINIHNNSKIIEKQSIQWVHRKCQKNLSEGSSIEGSQILLHSTDEDRLDAWWTIECIAWENWTKIVEGSLHRRIDKWLTSNQNSNSSIILRADNNVTTNHGVVPTTNQSTTMDQIVKIVKTHLDDPNNNLVREILGDWRIFIFDYKDVPYIPQLQQQLSSISQVVGWQRVFFITRTDVTGRKKGWRPFAKGRYTNWSNVVGSVCAGVKKFHFAVRDDVAEALENELNILRNTNETTADMKNNSDYSVYLPRPVDVAHWWNPNFTKKAIMRSSVSQHLVHMRNKYATDRNLSVVADIIGWRARKGRQGVHEAYVRALLETKIIVVTQRDRYEDHYRLFEALISGALVLSDQMLSFPWGVKDGSTIVVYQNPNDLEKKILYYLDNPKERFKIAKAGRELSLKHHRSYHRWEDLLLGNWTERNKYGLSPNHP